MKTTTLLRQLTAYTAVWLLAQSAAPAVTIPVADDAMAFQTNPTFNYGRRVLNDVYGTTNANRWTYIGFDDIRDYLPAGTIANDVVKAYLHLYVNTVNANGSVDLYAVAASWLEGTKTGATEASTLNWNSKPAATGSALNTIAITSANESEFISVDVTNLVKDWITNHSNNHGLVLKPNGTAIQVAFDSKENDGSVGTSHGPLLDIELTPTMGVLAVASGGTGAGSASAARTSLGAVGLSDTQTLTNKTINGANNTITNVPLATGVSGILPVANGGTGTSTAVGATDSLLNRGSDIASASTTDLSTATRSFVTVSGTTTINALGTVSAGVIRSVRFTGAGTITHNPTSLILPGAANITRADGDYAVFESLGSGNWRCLSYEKVTGAIMVLRLSARGDVLMGTFTNGPTP